MATPACPPISIRSTFRCRPSVVPAEGNRDRMARAADAVLTAPVQVRRSHPSQVPRRSHGYRSSSHSTTPPTFPGTLGRSTRTFVTLGATRFGHVSTQFVKEFLDDHS